MASLVIFLNKREIQVDIYDFFQRLLINHFFLLWKISLNSYYAFLTKISLQKKKLNIYSKLSVNLFRNNFQIILKRWKKVIFKHCLTILIIPKQIRINKLSPCFSCGSAVKESTCNVGDLCLTPGLGRSPGEGKGYPLQYSGLENSMDYSPRGLKESDLAWRLSVTHSSWVLWWSRCSALRHYLDSNWKRSETKRILW